MKDELTARQAQAALTALEDLNLMVVPGRDLDADFAEALEARIAAMNAEAGRILAQDLSSLMWANERGMLEDEW